MIRFFYFFIFLFLITLSSCNKKGKANFTIKGNITDLTFNKPLSEATLSLFEIEAGSQESNLVDTYTVGSSGEFSFTFPRNQAESYFITSNKENYFSVDHSISFSDLSIETDNFINLSTTAKSWAKLRFINNGGASSDVLQYNKQKGKSNCLECCPDGVNYLYGAVDTTIYCLNDGNTVYQYQYILQGTSVNGVKSATTTPFDTVELLLNY